jgi:RNA polymerase sigma-70 factor, ECF subfamily
MANTDPGSKHLEQPLARIAIGKDQAAFAELYASTKGKLFSTIVRIVKHWDIAEEILQEVYLRIWSNANSYRSSYGSPMTWMITIARNLAIDTVRRPMRDSEADDSVLETLPSPDPTVVETIEAAEDYRSMIAQHQKVLRALRTLDPARGDLVIAAYIHGESREQLSKRTGVPVNTVKTWIRRALLEVEAILRNGEREDETMFGHGRPLRRDVARSRRRRKPNRDQFADRDDLHQETEAGNVHPALRTPPQAGQYKAGRRSVSPRLACATLANPP